MKYKILAVDSSQTLLDVLSFAFEKNDLEVITTTEFEEAKKLIEQQNFSAVIYDLDLNGISFAEYLKKQSRKDIPIFIMSVHKKNDVRLKAKSSGVDGWILKPFIAEQLAKKIKRYLTGKKI